MAYICVVNPAILAEAGMDFGAVFVATCLAAAFGSFVMGFAANYPIALAPGMGLNAFFTFGVVRGMGHRWELALGAVFVAGLLFVVLSLLPVREWLINSIPRSLKLAIAGGIGLFLALIALRGAGIVVAHPATFVTLGKLTSPATVLAFLGFVTIVALERRRVPGAILLGMLAVTLAGLPFGLTEWQGVASAPPDPRPTFLALDVRAVFELGLLGVVFTFLLVDLFDSAGTLIGLAHHANMLDSEGRLPRLRRALLADSSATVVGALVGTSTTTSYVESAAGINAGGRTGLTAVTVGCLFLAALFFAPLAQTVPAFATAPALLFVSALMTRALAKIGWEDPTEYAPAVLTAIAMPLTYSITDGLALGFVSYALAKLLAGRPRECPLAVYVVSGLFVVRYLWFD